VDLQALKTACSQMRGAEASHPFGEGALVFKVMGKIFALMPDKLAAGDIPQLNLKCDPDLAEILRQTYDAVQPGYHMNKRHWNTVHVDGTIPEDEILEMIDHSYDLVVSSLPKKLQSELQNRESE
jgi:predicted DNA-binding protein (MmcQ/YjbR family)